MAGQPTLAIVDNGSSVGARELTFEQRVRAQEAIERVYWSHRIWPKENPGPKPPLSTVMPDAVIRAKVVDYLKKSHALDTWWQRPITAVQLQTEVDRMARSNRDATVLRELFDALGNDPFVIAETLARQTLAERLIRSWFASDTRFHAAVRERAEHALAGPKLVPDMKTLGGEYRETLWVRSQERTSLSAARNEVDIDAEAWSDKIAEFKARFDMMKASDAVPVNTLSSLKETPEGFSVVMVLESTVDRLRVATVVWPKTSFETWWGSQALAVEAGSWDALAAPQGGYVAPAVIDSACTADTWQPTRLELPVARNFHTAVWTGTEMIIWGGFDGSNTGARYNPSTDTWTATSTGTNVPSARWYQTAVWTGTEMIIWGGVGDSGDLRTGARYSPSSDTWTPTGTTGAPSARQLHTAVWTGTQMIVWGGGNGTTSTVDNDGGRYTPSTDAWTATSTGTNVPAARYGQTVIWTGSVMIVWGGQGSVVSNVPLNTGGRYTPATNSWLATATGIGLPSARMRHAAVWTGTEMIVWGGDNGASTAFNTGGRYNPSTGAWTATSTGTNVPSARFGHTAIWTGSAMVIWGGGNFAGPTNTGGRYTPSSNSWTATSTGPNTPSARSWHGAVWTGTEMIVSAGTDGAASVNTGGRYDPSADSWVPTASSFAPAARAGHSAVWTGAEMIVWGGRDNMFASFFTGGRYDPAIDTWTPTSIGTNVPPARSGHSAVWTGTEMIVWGGSGSAQFNDGGRYNPSTDSWTATSTGANTPSVRSGQTAVWTGTEMIVWGGLGQAYLDDGGRYNPSGDSWTATSTGLNVPSARAWHTAVWTGSEMIVWGGYDGNVINTGGRYNPSTDSWGATDTGTNVPSARDSHTAIWTGTEMIVWGGFGGSGDVNTGARYSPSSDTWTATGTTGAPSPREGHTAVWTGTEMIAWGASGAFGPGLNDGGRYSPSTDSWTPTSTGTNTPTARNSFTAVWSGTEMIIWGGQRPSEVVGSGGRYCVDICGPSVVCDDGNSCTNDSCDSATGCVATNSTDPCSDGNACTAGDTCGGGVCNAGTAITAPPEVQSVAVAGDKATYSWPAALYATQYDVVRGMLGALPVGPGGGDESCFDDLAGPTVADPTSPAPGTGFWYLARGENSCGIGTFGNQSNGSPRTTTTCP
jgi:hypothetical protein